MDIPHSAAAPFLLLAALLVVPATAPANVNLADHLRAQPSEQVTLDAAVTYTGPINLGPGDRAYVVDGNGASILLDGSSLSVNGQAFTLTNATISGPANSKVVLIECPDIRLHDVTITGNTLHNGIYSIDSSVELAGVTIENAGVGMFLSGGSLHFAGGAAFRNCNTGLHLPQEATITSNLGGAGEIAFENCVHNGLLATNSEITINGAMRLVDNGAGLRLNSTTMSLNGPGFISGAQSGVILEGGASLSVHPGSGRFEVTNCTNNGVFVQGSTLAVNSGYFREISGYPVNAAGGTVTLAQGTVVRDNSAGVVVDGAQLQVFDSEFARNGDFDVDAGGGSTATIHSSSFTGSNIAIKGTNGTVLDVYQCNILDPVFYGINMFRLTPGAPPPTGTIRGNTIRTTPNRLDRLWESGVNMIDSEDVLVEGNTIEHWRTGVQVNTSTATVADNWIGWIYQPDGFGARGQGVGVINDAHATIRQNHIYDTEGDNVFIAGGSTALVERNLLERSRENGVLVEGIEPGAPLSFATVVNNDIRNPTVGVGISGNTAAVVVGNSMYVPYEPREFADPSRGVWILNSPTPSVVENNLISSAPLNGVYIEASNNHIIRGNFLVGSGRNAAELNNATGVQFLSNTAWKSWENGIEVRGGGGHYFQRNNFVDAFQWQLAQSNIGLFYQVAFFNGATATLHENNFESSLPRKGGLENIGGGAIDARFNWWGSPGGPEFNEAVQGGPALVVKGPNINTAGHLSSPPVRAKVWDGATYPAMVPQTLAGPEAIGARIRFTPTQNVAGVHVAMSTGVTDGLLLESGLEDARHVRIMVDHRIRSTLHDGLLTLSFETNNHDAGIARYDAISQTWEKLAGVVYNGVTGTVDVTRHHFELPNTLYAFGIDPEAATPVEDFLLGRNVVPPPDYNEDGIIDAADLVLQAWGATP